MSAKTRSWQGPVRDKVTCDTHPPCWIHICTAQAEFTKKMQFKRYLINMYTCIRGGGGGGEAARLSCNMTHIDMAHICVTWHICVKWHICFLTHICMTWLVCDMTYTCVWHDAYDMREVPREATLIWHDPYTCEGMHVWHDSYVTWLRCAWQYDMLHSAWWHG